MRIQRLLFVFLALYLVFIGGSAYVDDLLDAPFVLDALGRLAIPDRPGLGVALDPARVARYTPDVLPLRP